MLSKDNHWFIFHISLLKNDLGIITLGDEKTGPFRVPEILSNDEIQVFKNLKPPVPEELILFNVFKKVLVTSVQTFLK